MRFKVILASLILAGSFGLFYTRSQAPPLHDEDVHPAHSATVYKTPTCGCCGYYPGYLRTKNYTVEVVDMEQDELDKKKEELGIPGSLDSCHTTVINGSDYFAEGHIPFEAINKMLDERPDIKGIGLPGMPHGSPGMGGNKTEPFNIMQVAKDGSVKPYVEL